MTRSSATRTSGPLSVPGCTGSCWCGHPTGSCGYRCASRTRLATVMADVRGLLVAVRLRLLHTEEGGRRAPITSARFGYRPNWGLPGTDHPREQSGGPLLCLGADQLHPGQTARAVLMPLFIEAWQWLEAGEQIHAYESPQRVGQAEVLMISGTNLTVNDEAAACRQRSAHSPAPAAPRA